MIRLTLDEIVEEALLLGYDFNSLYSNLKKSKRRIKEYVYGYTLAEDKLSYLESMGDNTVVDCDRIRCFEKELEEYRQKIKLIPQTRMMAGFFVNEKIVADDGSVHDVSVYRIVSVDEDAKTAFVKDVEYIDYGFSEALCTYHADLDYEDIMDHINTKGFSDLFDNTEEYANVFAEESEIDVS